MINVRVTNLNLSQIYIRTKVDERVVKLVRPRMSGVVWDEILLTVWTRVNGQLHEEFVQNRIRRASSLEENQ